MRGPILWVISLLASVLVAQTPFRVSVDVDITNVEVVVTNPNGRPVTGLTRDDFSVYENGKLQPLTNFLEVREGVTAEGPGEIAAPAPARAPAPAPEKVVPRYIVFFIDQSSLMPNRRRRLLDAIGPLVQRARPEDRMMVVAANPGPDVRVAFTADRQKVLDAIDKAISQSPGGLRRAAAFARTRQEMLATSSQPGGDWAEATHRIASAFAAEELRDLQATVRSVESVVASVAGIEGRKAVVLISEGLPIDPGRPALDEARALAGRRSGESESEQATAIIEELAARANQSGVTLYPVHAAGLDSSAELTTIPGQVGFATGSPNAGPSSDRWGSFQLLASETGGVASVSTGEFGRVFSTLDRDLGTYYSLGYRTPETTAEKPARRIEVRVRREGLQVRARRSFSRRTEEERARDAVLAALVASPSANDLAIDVALGAPERHGRSRHQVQIQVKIPVSRLTLLPSDGLHVGGFTVLLAAADGKRRLSEVTRRSVDVRVPDPDFAGLAGQHFTYTLPLSMAPGTWELSIGVVDRNSGVAGYVTRRVNVPR